MDKQSKRQSFEGQDQLSVINSQQSYSKSYLNKSQKQGYQSQQSFIQQNTQSSVSSIQQSQRQKLENMILKQVITKQKKKSYQVNLNQQIINKHYENKSKSVEEQLAEMIHNLVQVRILVNIYDKSQFRLVLAHYHLGQAYLKYQSIDMAIQHLSLAAYFNQQLELYFPKCKALQQYIINTKAQALINQKNYSQAMQLLNQNLKMNTKYNLNFQSKNKSMSLLAQCYSKTNQQIKALQTINNVIIEIKKKQLPLNILAFSMIDKAIILSNNKNYQDAIETQNQAIKILISINYSKPQIVVKMYQKLSQYYSKACNPQSSLYSMQKVRTLYQQLYPNDDRRIIIIRRKIAVALLKIQRFKQAINQLMEIIQIQQKIYGQSSLSTARTLKLLGIVYQSLDTNNARVYLNKAMKIFSRNSMHKQVIDIKQKINSINQVAQQKVLDIFPHSQQEI